MKKIFYLACLCTTLFSSFTAIANVITVKGYVRLANGNGVANIEVKIASYVGTSNTSCSEQAVVTNSAGFYSKEITCTGDIHFKELRWGGTGAGKRNSGVKSC
jgi:hypothetical protein